MGCGVRAEGAMRGVGCARLRRAGEGAGAGERAESSGAEKAQGRETASPMVLHCGILWESR